ncbi:MAG: hypothetical protein JWO08_183 [Verrucomicrobiaceae bacterium]|nr:hypothetical protein [Verrucomicrobiaceae bacterium]
MKLQVPLFDHALVLPTAVLAMGAALVSTVSAASAPLAYYPGEFSMADSSGNGHNGTGTVTYATGKRFVGFHLSSASSHHLDFSDGWFDSQNFSFDLWVRDNSTAGSPQADGAVLATHLSSLDPIWKISYSASGGTYVYEGGDLSAPLSFVISRGAWHHLAVTRNGTSRVTTVYLDGAMVAQATGTGDINYDFASFMRFGSGKNLPVSLDCDMDEIRFYDRALTAAEVVAAAADYDAVRDFTFDANSEAQLWQYGFTGTDGSGFTDYTEKDSGTAPFKQWQRAASDMAVVASTSGQAASYNATTSLPPDELGLLPGSDGRKSVVRWLAPSSGTFQVTGQFEGIESTGTSSDVSIVQNGDAAHPLLFQPGDSSGANEINGLGSVKTFAITVSAAAGDTLDFRVGWGGNSQSDHDATGLKARITQTSTSQAAPTVQFSATGPSGDGAPILFAATTASGWNVRVQSSTTPNSEASWKDLADGNGGAMAEDSQSHGHYSLNTNAYTAGTGISFRAVVSKTGEPDVLSPPLGPFSLHQAVLGISATQASTSDWARGATAYIDDYLIYKLTFQNSGDIPAKALRVRTQVPKHLHASLPIAFSTTLNSRTVTLTSGDTSLLAVGGSFNGGNNLIPGAATITEITDATHLKISQNATATGKGTSTVVYGALAVPFEAKDLSISAGGTYMAGPGANEASIVWDVGDLPGAPGFTYSQYVSFAIHLTGKVRTEQSIVLPNDYTVFSTSSPPQPFNGTTGFLSHAANVECQINGSISFTLVPQSKTVAPGGLMTYVFTLTNRGSTVAKTPVAVVTVPDHTRFAASYPPSTTPGVKYVGTGAFSAANYKQVYVTGQTAPQVVMTFPDLAAHAIAKVYVTFQAQWTDPADVAKISSISYAATFFDPAVPKPVSALAQFQALFKAAGTTPSTAGTTNFLALATDPSHKIARSQNQSGMVEVALQGSLDGQPLPGVFKQISSTSASLQEDEIDGTVNIAKAGDKVSFILGLVNLGDSPADEVFVQDSVLERCHYLPLSAVVLAGGTKSKAGSKLVARLDGDGRHVRFEGLHLEPHDVLSVLYTVTVDSGPSAPPVGDYLAVGPCNIGSGSSPHTYVGLVATDAVKVVSPPRFAQPEVHVMVPRPQVSANVTTTASTLTALYKKTPSAVPLTDTKNAASYIPGVERYYIHFSNVGDLTATNVKVEFPVPAHTTFYRASWVKLTTNTSPGSYGDMPGTLIANPLGGSITPAAVGPGAKVTFALTSLKPKLNQDVMVEVIVNPDAVNTAVSQIGDPASQTIVISATNAAAASLRTTGPRPSDSSPDSFAIKIPAHGVEAPNVPKVGLVQTVSTGYARPGDQFTVTLTVANKGDLGCHPIVEYRIPDNAKFISADAGQSYVLLPATNGPGNLVQAVLASNNGSVSQSDQTPLLPHTAAALTITLEATGAAPGVVIHDSSKVTVDYVGPIFARASATKIVTPAEFASLQPACLTTITGISYSALNNGAVLIDIGGGNIVAQGAGNIVAQGAGNIIAQGAGNIVPQGAGNIVAAGAGNLIAIRAAPGLNPQSVSSLLANGSAALLSQKLGNLFVIEETVIVAAGAGNMVAAGGGNIVAAGAGNIAAAGGGNIVAAGAGNIVAAGAGNIVAAGAGNIVAAGAGNIVAAGAGNIVAAGAGNIVAAGAGNILSSSATGGATFISAGAAIVAAGGSNLVAQGGGN